MESLLKLKSKKKWGMVKGLANSLKIHLNVIKGLHINTFDKEEQQTYHPLTKPKQNQLPTIICQINKRC